ncbi:MAG TPA: metallophosphoesterase [Prolixibacteraceae bacterium]|nr:metallophosphoesterase [Prolixibacteraceae bacterium]
MLIQYASDLHLEFPENRKFLHANPLLPKGDILLLAGDIVPFAIMDKHADFFNYVSDHFQTVYWIPGNHEYYYSDAATKCGMLKEKIRSNVLLVNNTTVQHENIHFIFSTLWSKIRPGYEWQIERGISDFQVIKFNGYRFSSVQFNQLHEESLVFLKQELASERVEKKVVVTHHVPTFLNYPEKYKGDVLNDAFAVELFGLIEDIGPDFWIYGHIHGSIPEFKIGETQLLTNQLGYVKYEEHKYFNNTATLEV